MMEQLQAVMQATTDQCNLVVPDIGSIRSELQVVEPQKITIDPKIEQAAENFVQRILAVDPNTLKQGEVTVSVERMGAETQEKANRKNEMLSTSIKTLAARGEDGGPIAKAIVDLNMQVDDLDPGKLDLEEGWFARLMDKCPIVGHKVKHYFMQYESAQTVINSILRSLKDGKDMLGRDNICLKTEQDEMRDLTLRLEQTVQLGMSIDQKFTVALSQIGQDDSRRRFIEEELLFSLRQRVEDLQQYLAVCQQGVLSTEIIIRNNKELMRGVGRALNVTINALRIAVILAVALADQKIVLEKIEALNTTTNRLIEHNAAQLRTQGVAIHKQASSTQLDMESLKKSFADIKAAMEDISTFRRQALPVMAQSILEMDSMTKGAEESIRKMEEGNKAVPEFHLDILQ